MNSRPRRTGRQNLHLAAAAFKARIRRRELVELCWRVALADGRVVECDIRRCATGLEVRLCETDGVVLRQEAVADLEHAHQTAERWRREFRELAVVG